jgi:hypothetical protein
MNRAKPTPDAVPDLVERQRLALDAEVNVKTLERALAGLPVRPSTLHRIRRVLAARDRLDLLPAGRAR